MHVFSHNAAINTSWDSFQKAHFSTTDKFANAQSIAIPILTAQGIITVLRRIIKVLPPNCGFLSHTTSILVFTMYLYQPSIESLRSDHFQLL